ncbi:MAG: PAS domain S-box protein, partial [Candidatus Marinimicrobia bacterium]|nr:PAS domain S-box protein [Candidatus Neomarinimicrobiota bacterium]
MRQSDDYAHLQAIVENALDVIIRINEKGIIEWVNSASKRIFGYTQNELVGKNVSVLVPDPDGIKHDSYISRYIKTKDKRVIGKGKDVLCRKKDGTTFPVHLSIIEIKIDSVRYFTGILRDITGLKQNEIELAQYREHLEEMVESRTKDLKRSNNNLLKKVAERSKIEEGLRESEERFRTLSETAFEAIVIAEKGKIVETSPKFAKMFGYKQSEMIGMTALELTAPEYQELVMTNIKNDIEKPYEAVAVRKDQSTFHFEAQGVKISYNGEKVRLTAIRDISQRKAAEMDIHKSNNLLQALNRIQADYIKESDKKAIFDKQLEYLLSMTQSEYGFICEVLHDSDGAPYLKSFAITNVAWNRETKKFYKKNAPKGLEFRNLDTLYGAVVKSGEPVISNDPSNDPRGRGKPKGHPPLNSFLGVPLYSEGEMVGMLGIANRPGGYDEKLVDFLEPFFRTSGNIIQALRMERELTKAGENIHLLQSITQAVNESQGFHSALEITLKKVCNSIGWDFGESWILNSDSTLLEYGPVWYSSNSEKLKDFKRVSQKFTFSLNSGLPGKVWSSKKPMWIKNTSIESEKIFHRAKYVQDAGLKAGFGVPLIAADQVIAVLVFFNFQSFKEDKRKVEIVSAVAAQLGSVVQRKQAEEKLKESEER